MSTVPIVTQPVNLDPGLLQGILDHPDDDLRRLIAADWLEDHGQIERAEFIRVQCRINALEAVCTCGGCVKKRGGGQHMNGQCAVDRERDELPDGTSRQALLRRRERELLSTTPVRGGMAHNVLWLMPTVQNWVWKSGQFIYRRGFVHTVCCRLADWYGGWCKKCNGGKFMREFDELADICPKCKGSGHSPGHGPAFVRNQPIERVEVTDREPWVAPDGFTSWSWGIEPAYGQTDNSVLPTKLLKIMEPDEQHAVGVLVRFADTPSAKAALSRALILDAKTSLAPSGQIEAEGG